MSTQRMRRTWQVQWNDVTRLASHPLCKGFSSVEMETKLLQLFCVNAQAFVNDLLVMRINKGRQEGNGQNYDVAQLESLS